MRHIKKVGILVYVPAGDICEGATFKCPLLVDMFNTPACYCLLIPESFWWNYARKTKHKSCPSLFHYKGNKLSEEDIKNHRLRLVQKCIKEGNIDQLLEKGNNNTTDKTEE